MRVLAPAQAPKLINTLRQKLSLIESSGIEIVLAARFDAAFAARSADEFIRQYLVEGLRARALCVGNNFTFGNRQSGNIETLRNWGHAFELIEVPAVAARGTVVSSTQVRQCIQQGRGSRACRLLGRQLDEAWKAGEQLAAVGEFTV